MMGDFEQRFGGIARLYGTAGLARLRAAHVCVVGVGGVGSWIVEALARSGIGALTLIDLDDVCITNVNRQLPAHDGNIGRPKIDALADRVRLIHPACRVERVAEFFTASTADALLGAPGSPSFSSSPSSSPLAARSREEDEDEENEKDSGAPRFDFVVDAIDKLTNKCLLIAGCVARGVPVLTMGGAGGKRDATQVRVRDLAHTEQDEMLRQVRRMLRRDFGFQQGTHSQIPTAQTPFGIPAVFSPEKPVYPWADGTCAADAEPGSSLTLDCATGFGTATFVTGAFGFAAAGEVVRRLVG